MSEKKDVMVFGAGGRTGLLVVKKLLEDKVAVRATVRSEQKRKELETLGVDPKNISVIDVTDERAKDKLSAALAGTQAVVDAVGAVPKFQAMGTLFNAGFKLLTLRPGEILPQFSFNKNCAPKEVDWAGRKVLIDAARAAGVGKYVLLGSMGGTDRDHFMNRAMDNVLEWKRKAEVCLMQSGLNYCIIHAGRLSDEPPTSRLGPVLGVDDEVFKEDKTPKTTRDSFASLAAVAATSGLGDGQSLDLLNRAEGKTPSPTRAEWEAILAAFKRTCDYTINPPVKDWS